MDRNPVTGKFIRQGKCDHCGSAVYVRGIQEPEWVHYHGSVFCMTTTAAVDGKINPNDG